MIRYYIKFKLDYSKKHRYGRILQEVERYGSNSDKLKHHYLVEVIDNPLDFDSAKITEKYEIKIVSPYDVLMVYNNSKIMKKELSGEEGFDLFNDRPTKDD